MDCLGTQESCKNKTLSKQAAVVMAVSALRSSTRICRKLGIMGRILNHMYMVAVLLSSSAVSV